MNTALQRLTQAALTNKSGGAVAQGDVVVVDLTTAASFTTTTTTPFLNGLIGVVLEPNGIASNAVGMIAFAGPIPKINLSAAASLGDLFKTHSVAKQAVRHAAGIVAGDFGMVLGTGTTPAAVLWGMPAGSTGAGVGDFSGPGSSVSGNLVGFNGTGGKTGQDSGLGLDGWAAAGETWTYVSADGPTGVFSVPADVTGKYQPGMRVKYTQTTVKYGLITAVGAFAAGVTPITIYGGTDYVTANAAITLPFYSTAKAPFGFPLDPAKWTVEVTDTSNRTQASPTAGTWYNPGSLTISIPIGAWLVSYWAVQNMIRSGDRDQFTTLSTANNTGSDVAFTAYTLLTTTGGGQMLATVTRTKTLTLAAKTSYFLNCKAGNSGMTQIGHDGSSGTTVLRAVSAYL